MGVPPAAGRGTYRGKGPEMRRTRSTLTLAVPALLLAAATLPAAAVPARAGDEAELTIIIEAIRKAEGRVHIGVWADPEAFGDERRRVAGTSAPVHGSTEVLTIKGLPPGKYAIAAFHDENDNGDFDRTWIGLPAEGLGFSNGAWITILGKPSFEQAAIELKGPGTRTVIPLKY